MEGDAHRPASDEIKQAVIDDFCEPLEREQKDKCVDFYEDWTQKEEIKKQSEPQE